MGTGTVMFKINDQNDRDILFGKKKFEFRLETEPLSEDSFQKMIGDELNNLVKSYY